MNDDIFHEYKDAALNIEKVKVSSEKLTIYWAEKIIEEFKWGDLKKAAIITTADGPLKPDVFWFFLFNVPVMVPLDDLCPGSMEINDIMFEMPNFDFDKFIESQSSTEGNAFEVFER
ncbi:MAG: hypothetical protein ACTSR8_17760 [Promethearchaeota archaeon]